MKGENIFMGMSFMELAKVTIAHISFRSYLSRICAKGMLMYGL